jgi:ABC-type uncharacterized transport system substrate-binding protein
MVRWQPKRRPKRSRSFLCRAPTRRIGLVERLNRPGGNLTGIDLFLAEVAGKRLELLLELVPAAKSIAYLRNPTNPVFAESETREVQLRRVLMGCACCS